MVGNAFFPKTFKKNALGTIEKWVGLTWPTGRCQLTSALDPFVLFDSNSLPYACIIITK